MTIRQLPETLVNRIAAGEVVERPASVVKELVENSIDANATQINTLVREGGRAEIIITDDGCGIARKELHLALERHATSKLSGEDLFNISSLGFRGEALASIGAISRLKLTSRRLGDEEAWMLEVEGGRIGDLEPVAHPIGTRIEIRDLFYATPARLKFLKTPRTELGHINEIMKRLAMAHPSIGFVLNDGDRDLLSLAPIEDELQNSCLKRLASIIGREFAENALEINAEREDTLLTGYVGLPTLNRGNAKMQFLFVNGRPVRDKLFYGALRGAYRDFLASDRYPLVALFLTVPPEKLDVNVHPAKIEVRFSDANKVRGLIVGAIKHALAEAGHRASTTIADGVFASARQSHIPLSRGYPNFISMEKKFPQKEDQGPNLFSSNNNFDAPLSASVVNDGLSASTSESPDTSGFPLGVARAQLHETYIIAQTSDGIVIVDQHAAHERLVHERIKHSLETGGIRRQGLLIPEVVELDPASAERLLARSDELLELGIALESFGSETVVVREIPALLKNCDVQSLVRDLVIDFDENDEALALKDRLGDITAKLACHSSVRAGRRLNADEMNSLLREMEATPHSGQCSHGRPTYVELKLRDIERLFGRR